MPNTKAETTKQRIRVRYAPSPTGLQHIGGVRTALFNYLFARHHGGTFLLRIEDTDQQRSEQKYVDDLYQSLDFLGIKADEGPREGGDYGPYIQSQRFDLYQKYSTQLLESGHAYYCFCTSERLEQLRKEQEKNKSSHFGYDRHCRSLPHDEALQRKEAGEPCVMRFKIPLEGSTSFDDAIIGQVERANSDINPDPVLLKTDGYPTYHLANVIDDHLMEITHVMRAQEWLPSGALHVLLYQAFGWEPPQFCHLPMVMGQDGSKLSKRHGATSLADFRAKGYLAEAIVSYIALLGWAFDDSREFFSLKELEECFELSKLSSSPATFDYQKLEWFNGQYLRQWSPERLAAELEPLWQQAMPEVYSPELTASSAFIDALPLVLPLVQQRIKYLIDAPAALAYFFQDPDYSQAEAAIPKKYELAQTKEQLAKTLKYLESQEWPSLPSAASFEVLHQQARILEGIFRQLAEELAIKLGPLMHPVRYAVCGSLASPPLMESMLVLGKERTISRLRNLQNALEAL